MKIPSKFSLMGRTITVVENPQLIQSRNWTGAADYNRDIIELLPESPLHVSSAAKSEQTFCHEFVHFLLYHAGGAINYNLKEGNYIHLHEEFVDLLGSLLHQALTTMEYDEPNTMGIVPILDSLDDSLGKALHRKSRKVSEMESHLIDVSGDLARLREIIAPGTMKTPFDVEA